MEQEMKIDTKVAYWWNTEVAKQFDPDQPDLMTLFSGALSNIKYEDLWNSAQEDIAYLYYSVAYLQQET